MTPWGADSEFDGQALIGRTILQVAPALDGGADSLACVETAAALAEAGARALVAGAPGPLVSELQARGGVFIPFATATKNPWTAAFNRMKLERLASREGADLIHLRGGAGLAAAAYAAHKAHIPLVAEAVAGAETPEADSVIFFSDAGLEAATNAHPERAAHFYRGLRGVDLRAYAPDNIDSARVRRLREAWGVKAHVRLIVTVGLPPERQKWVLAAAAQLKARGFFANEAQEARLIWRQREGSDMTPGFFEDEAKRLGLEGDVLRIACADRAAACLAAAIVLAPAGDASFAIEAQALGAPVALLQKETGESAESICAPPTVEPSGRTGWVIPPGQAQTLARAIDEACRMAASARESLALRARDHARGFSTDRMSALTLALYARRLAGA